MKTILQHDRDTLDTLLELTKTEALSYLENLNDLPTSVVGKDLAQRALEAEGKGAEEALSEFIERFRPLMVASSGPRYWGFVTGGATPASIVGDWLASVYDQNTQTARGFGDVSASIELETIGLIRKLLDLPDTFFGGFVTGATLSNFTCLATARQWTGKQHGYDFAGDGMTGSPKIPILSATPHSSAAKSLAMLGMGRNSIIRVDTLEGGREAIDVSDLRKKLDTLRGAPCILISSAGTVNSGDFDDFKTIAGLRKEYSFWWHIDAAFGAFAACSPKFRHLVQGWEKADSITVDCHKWMNVPYDSAIFLIKEEYHNHQIDTFRNSNAPYLGETGDNLNYLNLLPENSRRLRALSAWFGLVAYGRNGYGRVVEHNVALAHLFADGIRRHKDLELLAPVHLNTVSFSLKNAAEQVVETFLNKLNTRGTIFVTPSEFQGRKGIRAALVNWRTQEQDVELALQEIDEVLKEL